MASDFPVMSSDTHPKLGVIITHLKERYTKEELLSFITKWYNWEVRHVDFYDDDALVTTLKATIRGSEGAFHAMFIGNVIENMPLYINVEDKIMAQVAEWRLSCGK